jgi:DNA-binding MarR family transcriptional regulator
MSDTPKFATLLYDVRAELEITWIEYIYLDMVFYLSHDGWCYKSLDNIGKDLGIDKSNVYRMRNRLIERGLLKKNIKGYVKTTEAYAKRIRTSKSPYAKRNEAYAKRNEIVGKTHTKNNNRNTENNGMTAREVMNRFYTPKKSVLPGYVLDERV